MCEFCPALADHLLLLLRCPRQGVAEIPDAIWELDTPDIAAYLGVIAANPHKLYVATPSEGDWGRVVHYLTVVGAEYGAGGRVRECMRLARKAIAADAELLYRFRRSPIYRTLNEPVDTSWPLPNLRITENAHAEGSTESGGAKPSITL